MNKTPDSEGNTLDAVAIPAGGFIAVQMSGAPSFIEPAAGALTPLVLPSGYKKIGLFTDDGAPADDMDSDDDIEMWQSGYKISGDVTSRTVEVTTAELNDRVRQLVHGVPADANGLIVVDQGNQNRFPMLQYIKYKNGVTLRRNGLARVKEVKPAQQTRGEVAGYDITFEWLRDEGLGGFYREWVVDPVSTQITKIEIQKEDGSAVPKSLTAGTALALRVAATTSDNATQVVSATWASSDSTKATVASGLVTAVSAGAVVITANYAGATATISLNIVGA